MSVEDHDKQGKQPADQQLLDLEVCNLLELVCLQLLAAGLVSGGVAKWFHSSHANHVLPNQ